MAIRRVEVPKPLVDELRALSRASLCVLRLALAWWVRRLERQLEEFGSSHPLFNVPRQLLSGRRRSADGQACPNIRWTICGARCR